MHISTASDATGGPSQPVMSCLDLADLQDGMLELLD
jgi:hypothetical protein